MSFKDKLKASQGGSGNFVKLPIAVSFSLGEDGGGVYFKSYDTEKQENVFLDKPITGMYIGGAMKLSAYDDNIGSKGGNVFSAHYFTKENITLFKPGKTVEKVCVGNMDVIEKWIAENTTSRVAKKKWCFMILTKDGLIEVQTNMVIAIDQLKKNKEGISERYVTLTPTLYTPKTDISKSAHDYLGKFAKKNPPKFAYLTLGAFISEDDFNNWNAEAAINAFTKYKAQQSKPDKIEVQPTADPPHDHAQASNEIPQGFNASDLDNQLPF